MMEDLMHCDTHSEITDNNVITRFWCELQQSENVMPGIFKVRF